MTIQDLDGKNVCVLGYGREGRATVESLRTYAPTCRITIADANPEAAIDSGLPLISGPGYLDKLRAFDAIIKSPGISWHPEADISQRLTSATELFLKSLPKKTTVIGITGTKGKSTTASLIHQVLTAGGRHAILAGNIGEPMISHLPDATDDTIFVLELSSYQLEMLHVSPHIAVITSFYADHLDYHGSLKNYLVAKGRIVEFQTASDIVFFNGLSPECTQLAQSSPGRRVPFSPGDFPGSPRSDMANNAGRSNLAAAFLVAKYFGLPEDQIIQSLESATGLPHRGESLGNHHGIVWIDDASATTPQSTLAALDLYETRVDTIIVGGLDRGYDFSDLGSRLAHSNIGAIVLFPDTGDKIRTAIEKAHPSVAKTYLATSSMDEAISFAMAHTEPGRICLLSSGAPSYNLFKNYSERGDAFRTAIHADRTSA